MIRLLFVFLAVPLITGLFFTWLYKSPRFAKLCAFVTGEADDRDAIAVLEDAQENVERKIVESDHAAERQRRNAEILREKRWRNKPNYQAPSTT